VAQSQSSPVLQTNAIVQLSDVVKTYKVGDMEVPAIRNISLEIPRQRFSMIVGPSGSGKTTLLNLIGCIDKPDGRCRATGHR
jgi:putative ABC transport system ATP-binding protein